MCIAEHVSLFLIYIYTYMKGAVMLHNLFCTTDQTDAKLKTEQQIFLFFHVSNMNPVKDPTTFCHV